MAERPLEPCPACDQATLSAAGAGEVCGVCGWQDEARLREDPERHGPGDVTLEEARRNVREYGVAYPPYEVGV